MNQVTSGRKGGIATRDNHLSVCSECGYPVKSEFFTEIGQKGGETTKKRHGRAHYVKAGKEGGRGNKKK